VYSDGLSQTTLANTIASLIVESRCPPAIYQKWKQSLDGTLQLTALEKKQLETYIKPSIGLNGSPATDNELQGVVAEYLWYEFIKNKQTASGRPIKIDRPSLRVTEPGGDGLVVYKVGEGVYIFRLWEVKKHASTTKRATTKVTEASKQLADNGAEYLAKFSKIEQEIDHQYPGLSEFHAKLVSMWLMASSDSGAGVSVTKEHASVMTASPISIMKTHLPDFSADDQLEGFVISIPDFVDLSYKVREELWRGI
jgi:hypothetical protein